LAHVAALVPVNAVQLLEPGLKQDCFFDHEIAAAVGYPERESQPIVVCRLRPRDAGRLKSAKSVRPRQQQARAELDKAWIRVGYPVAKGHGSTGLRSETKPRTRGIAEGRRDGESIADVGEGDLGAQLEHREPPQEIGEAPALTLEEDGLAPLDQEEIMQILALRRQERRIDRAMWSDLAHVVGHEALQERHPIGARNLENAAGFQQRIRSRSHPVPRSSLARPTQPSPTGRERVKRRLRG